MRAATDDWRRMGQERALPPGTALVFRRYRARSETWEHEHCLFCFAKFMDPNFSEAHRRFIEEHDDVLTQGYTTMDEHPQGADGHWLCEQCVEDFAEEFELRVDIATAAPQASARSRLSSRESRGRRAPPR